jgi:hypothetical protein
MWTERVQSLGVKAIYVERWKIYMGREVAICRLYTLKSDKYTTAC